MLRQFIIIIFALAALFLLSKCAPPTAPQNGTTIKDQYVTITEVHNGGKHSHVYWKYDMPLPNGTVLQVYGQNSERARRKDYNLQVGQKVLVDIYIYPCDPSGTFRVSDVDFSAFQQER